MAASTPSAKPGWLRRAAAVGLGAVALTALMTSSALAGKPATSPSPNDPLEFAAGEVCDHAIRFENTTLRSRDSVFDPARDGSQRIASRGMGVSTATDLDTGATYAMRGGFVYTLTIAADGTVRIDASGSDILAWYYPGDDSDLAPGLYDVNGSVTEWYAPDGSFVRATFRGTAVDVCAALGA